MTKKKGQRIRELREDRGVPQKEIAEMLGMGLQSYRLVEGGELTIGYASTYKIAKSLGVDVKEIVKGEEEYDVEERASEKERFYTAHKRLYSSITGRSTGNMQGIDCVAFNYMEKLVTPKTLQYVATYEGRTVAEIHKSIEEAYKQQEKARILDALEEYMGVVPGDERRVELILWMYKAMVGIRGKVCLRVDMELLRKCVFLVGCLEEKEIEKFIDSLSLGGKIKRLRSIDVTDYTATDMEAVKSMEDMYSIEYIANTRIVVVENIRYLVNKDDLLDFEGEQYQVLVDMAKEPNDLVNPVYVEIDEAGCLVVD